MTYHDQNQEWIYKQLLAWKAKAEQYEKIIYNYRIMKQNHLHIRVDNKVKNKFVNTIKEKGFTSISKAIGFATEQIFGINVVKRVDNENDI